jgi:elongation factor P
VRVEQYAKDMGDEGYLHQFWTFDDKHQHPVPLNPGENTELAGYPAGFRFSPGSQWLVRMQKLRAGYQTLFLYRRNGHEFSSATPKPLGDLAWDYFFGLPVSKKLHRDPKERDSLNHVQVARLCRTRRQSLQDPAPRPEITTAQARDRDPWQPAGTGRKMLASGGQISMLRHETASMAAGHACPDWSEARNSGKKIALKVTASSIRKGNVIEQDGKLYVVLTAENIHPGKGTPVSQIEMRRISDGVKISERYKTTDQVEKATIEDHNFNYLYEDADGFHFMNADTYDQVQVPKDIIGNAAPYLQENMTVKLSLHGVIPVAIQMPQRATLEVVETEPVTKGQTASSSYKPAILSNGVRTAVPPHIGTGTRIVVMTEDGSYVERAKD